jgi:hypothetical protein
VASNSRRSPSSGLPNFVEVDDGIINKFLVYLDAQRNILDLVKRSLVLVIIKKLIVS